jgi:hypothetical protein
MHYLNSVWAFFRDSPELFSAQSTDTLYQKLELTVQYSSLSWASLLEHSVQQALSIFHRSAKEASPPLSCN